MTLAKQFPPLERLPMRPSGRQYPEPFETFWDTGPNAGNDSKGKAYKAWRKVVVAGLDIDVLQRGREGYRDYVASVDWLQPCHVQTWINREGWTAAHAQATLDAPSPLRGRSAIQVKICSEAQAEMLERTGWQRDGDWLHNDRQTFKFQVRP